MSKSIPEVDKEWRQRVSFDFGEGGMKQPDGFGDLSVDDEVTVVVTGKVSSIRQDADTSSFSLQMEKITLKVPGKGKYTTKELMREVHESKKR